MTARERVVIDTNALVSRLLIPKSVPGQAVRKAIDSADVLVSEATMNELAEVLSRRKFDQFISMDDRQQFIRLLARIVELVPMVYQVRVCRDPKDDRMLEVAVNGTAGLIITGDRDLLVLNPFQGIAIISPAEYLRR
jgi:uncharacterized protein